MNDKISLLRWQLAHPGFSMNFAATVCADGLQACERRFCHQF